jgi:PEP-CTERM motif
MLLRRACSVLWTGLLLLGAHGASALMTFDDPGLFEAGGVFLDFETTGTSGAAGVTFVTQGNATTTDWYAPNRTQPMAFQSLAGSWYLGNIEGFPQTSRFSDIKVMFGNSVDAAGAMIGQLGSAIDAQTLSISVLTGDNQTFIVDFSLGDPGSPAFLGFSDPSGIKEIRWRGGDSGFFGIDNFRAGTIVPEPGTAGLLGLGLALLARRSRRRG